MYSLSITKIYLYFKIFSLLPSSIYLCLSLSLSHLSFLSFKKGNIVVQKYLLESARYKTGIRQMKKKVKRKKFMQAKYEKCTNSSLPTLEQQELNCVDPNLEICNNLKKFVELYSLKILRKIKDYLGMS